MEQQWLGAIARDTISRFDEEPSPLIVEGYIEYIIGLIRKLSAPMDRLTIQEAQQQLLDLPNKLSSEPLIITRDGQPVMAAMSYEQLTSLLETLDVLADTNFANLLQHSISQADRGETLCWDDVQIQLDA
jgi:PHD/YefM family antitoxin component YafN of YafNO toxin-antitoxin module